MKVLVTASRRWTDAGIIRIALAELAVGPGDTLINGDAPGGDRLASRAGADRGMTLELHPCEGRCKLCGLDHNWTAVGKRAGPIRNQMMVDRGPDICLAFPTAESVGTLDCIERAKKACVPVTVFHAP